MRLYWGYSSIPELAGLPAAQQRTLWRKAFWRSIGHWQWWLGLLLFFLIELSGLAMLRDLGHNGQIETSFLAGFAGLVFAQFTIEAARADLRQREYAKPDRLRSVNFCPRCGSAVSEPLPDTCPRCSARLPRLPTK